MDLTRRQALSTLGSFLSLPALAALTGARSAGAAGRDPAAFLAAVRQGELARVRRMLAADATLARARDDAGRSAFVLAHVHGRDEIAALLRSSGLELDIVEAVLAEDWPRFEQLAKAHPQRLNAAHPIGGTPLHAAALVGSLDFWRLRSAGCEPDLVPDGGNGFTPARTAMQARRPEWARIAVTDLLANGADPNAAQRAGSTILHAAVQRRDELLVRLAVRKGVRVDAVDADGRTARALAEQLGWDAGARLLAAADRLPRDNRASRFALDANRVPVVRPDLAGVPQAVQNRVTGNSHGNLAGLRALVDKDPRLVFSVSTDDELAIEACAHTGARPIIRYHLDHGAPLSLPTAVSLGDRATVEFWLQRDPTLVHERGAHDFPLMWYALLGGGGVEMAELLAGHDTPVDQESMGTTTLHWCVRRDDRDLARWLLERGADPEPLGFRWHRDGRTPLQIAQAEDKTKMAALLRGAGAKR